VITGGDALRTEKVVMLDWRNPHDARLSAQVNTHRRLIDMTVLPERAIANLYAALLAPDALHNSSSVDDPSFGASRMTGSRPS